MKFLYGPSNAFRSGKTIKNLNEKSPADAGDDTECNYLSSASLES